MLVALSAWFVLTSLGFTTAGTHEVTMRVARRDFDGALAVFRSTWTFVTALSLAVAAALATGAAVSPVASWFGFSESGDAGAAAVIVLLLGQVFVHMQTELLGMGLIAAGRYGLYAFLVAATRLAAFLLVALALVLGGGPTSAAAAMAASSARGSWWWRDSPPPWSVAALRAVRRFGRDLAAPGGPLDRASRGSRRATHSASRVRSW